MNIKKYAYSIFLIAIGFFSCSEEQAENTNKKAEPGKYIVGINLNLESTNTRGVHLGGFNDTYEATEVYMHSIDGAQTQTLQIPVYQLNCADGSNCKGFKYQIVVNEDGSCTVTPYNAQGELLATQVTYKADEEFYFSSLKEQLWTDIPIGSNKDSKIFKKDEANVEIYRSSENYSIDDLTHLGGDLTFLRLCSAFDTQIIFSDIPASPENDHQYQLDPGEFESIMGSTIDKWYVKIYMGPSFTGNFNMATAKSTEGDYGFYATSGNMYVPMKENLETTYNREIIKGVGYQTDTNDPLIAPFDSRTYENRNRLVLFIFIKHWTGVGEPTSEWKANDIGAKYVRYETTFTENQRLSYNYRYIFGAIMDLHDLFDAFNTPSPSTKNINEGNNMPQEITIKNSIFTFERY